MPSRGGKRLVSLPASRVRRGRRGVLLRSLDVRRVRRRVSREGEGTRDGAHLGLVYRRRAACLSLLAPEAPLAAAPAFSQGRARRPDGRFSYLPVRRSSRPANQLDHSRFVNPFRDGALVGLRSRPRAKASSTRPPVLANAEVVAGAPARVRGRVTCRRSLQRVRCVYWPDGRILYLAPHSGQSSNQPDHPFVALPHNIRANCAPALRGSHAVLPQRSGAERGGPWRFPLLPQHRQRQYPGP